MGTAGHTQKTCSTAGPLCDLRFSSSIRQVRRSANGWLSTGGSKRAKEKEKASGVVLGAFVDGF
jgi:hypothetical protein